MTKKFKMYCFVACLLIALFTLSGIVQASYTSSYTEPTILIRKGSYGTGVKWVQDMLNHNGYNLTVDGAFGSNTYNAVTSFQSKNGLTVDGIVGKATRTALKNNVTGVTSIYDYRYTTTSVNFRSGPGTGFSSYGVIARNAKVYVCTKRSDGWVYAKYNGRYGYIYAQYLKYAPSATTVTSGLPEFSRTNTTLLGVIKQCKAYYSTNNFVYNSGAGLRSIPADKSKAYGGYYYVDCSTFVSWALYEYAHINGYISMQNYFSTQKSSSVFASIGASGGNDYVQVVSAKTGTSNADLSKAKTGDILVTAGHVEFFSSYTAGSGNNVSIKVYNCGSTTSLKYSGITTSGTTSASSILYILRAR